jgi:pre-mRNA-splicing factor CDC5/CEF1
MVRAFIKGGVWKNSEDEILKAAVQKYGKQQWARVASLLNRKTAKQCKARWHEWLDPSVRKVEWSREEEEKLLHLAKLMPAQWKTVGPLVGRTATQCQDHYEKLLDEAAATANNKGSGEDGAVDSTAGIRHQPLRVGQIDSHPETKPARPDPIDMDEDEIEMLQEARARLANTQGKKAKRKGREKMLAQAKRMADLQKRRELKQAGLISGQAKRNARKRLKGGDIDLGVEIPFHKPAPAGFHDVSGEVARSEALRVKQAKRVDFQQLNEQQYRSRDDEQQKAKKREEARLRALEKSNMNYVVAQVSKTNDPLNLRKRGPLALPAPSVSDRELQTLAKMEEAATKPVSASSSNGATSTLLADYSDRPLPTPMRTPAIASAAGSSGESKQRSILREASNLRMLERGQTPLLGGENPLLEERPIDGDAAMDVDVKPKARPATPGGPASSGITRDHFGLNQRPKSELREGFTDDAASVGGSTFATTTTAGGITAAMSIRDLARAERRAAKRARRELEEALAALPAPQFEYELEVPVVGGDDDEEGKVETVVEEDMADVDAQEKRRLRAEADKLYEARSSVVKRRDLPRPVGAIPEIEETSGKNIEKGSDFLAEALIDKERLTLLKHDAFAFPVEATTSIIESFSGDKKSKKKKKKRKQAKSPSIVREETLLERISEQALDAAKELIRLQYDQDIQDMQDRVQSLLPSGRRTDQAMDMIQQVILKRRNMSTSAKERFITNIWKDPNEDDQLIAMSLAQEFDSLEEATSTMHKRNEKLESKLALLTGGFVKRAQNSSSGILNLYQDLQNARIETTVYRKLNEQEELGAVSRIDRLRSDISRLEEDEERLKAIYNSFLSLDQMDG